MNFWRSIITLVVLLAIIFSLYMTKDGKIFLIIWGAIIAVLAIALYVATHYNVV